MGWFSGAHMVWMWVGWLAISAAIVWLAVWAVRTGVGSPEPGPGPGESAEAVLKRRYAHGEIDREEYRQRLEDLRR